MSITLNNSDFQCLQDQLVSLKAKNYELSEKIRRSQADFEAAKAKICSLQLKLEEQERDFQITSTTLRQEIQAVASINEDNDNKEINKITEELQQRYDRSVEVAQQLDIQNQQLNEKIRELEEGNTKLKEELDAKEKQIILIESESKKKLKKTIEEYKKKISEDNEKYATSLEAMKNERNSLIGEIDKLTAEASKFESRFESEIEERRIHERKGLQIVKELKRQLALEKGRAETLQKRIETLLSESPPTTSSADLENPSRLSTSSSNNGIASSSSSSSGNGSRANQDANSVGSWSFVPVKTSQKSSNQAVNDSLSICSIESEDRETVQQPCDTRSQDSMQRVASATDSTHLSAKQNLSASNSNNQLAIGSVAIEDGQINNSWRPNFGLSGQKPDGLLIEEQAALVDRVTRLQHDKWTLEEKLSYLEQANSSLSKDLADKSDMIKHYFFNQAVKARNSQQLSHGSSPNQGSNTYNMATSRRTSAPFTMNHLLSEKPNLKKVVDFLKERSQVTSGDSENITREATKKMQLMLEETLIKCLKLQENLDHVTSELNKLKS